MKATVTVASKEPQAVFAPRPASCLEGPQKLQSTNKMGKEREIEGDRERLGKAGTKFTGRENGVYLCNVHIAGELCENSQEWLEFGIYIPS